MLTRDKGSLLAVKYGKIQSFTVGTGVTIYEGALVAVKLGDGQLYKAEADDDDSEKLLVVGFSREPCIGGSPAKIRVRMDGKYRLKFSGGTPVVGKLAIVLDDETIQPFDDTAGKKNVVAGRITEVVDNQTIFIDLEDKPSRLATTQYD